MRYFHFILILSLVAHLTAQVPDFDPVTYPGQDRTHSFHLAAGSPDTTAVSKDDVGIVAWATGFSSVSYGSNVDAFWQTPTKALGPAVGGSFDIVCLGRGGEITLTFENPIINGDGFDFAVFENSYSDTFLELAWVEVSSDGVHFVRFPNLTYTPKVVGGFGNVQPYNVHGFAGKYRQSFGTPFDLSQLQLAYDAAVAGTDAAFSDAYRASLIANFSHSGFDLNNIRYVRLIDVIGNGTAKDATGFVIYDPFPTFGSAGFDLDAVGVMNQVEALGTKQTIDFSEIGNRRLSDGTLTLQAMSSSGLAVSYTVVEGAASLSGNSLTPIGLGAVVVQASQAGDATHAPAAPVTQSFVVADELQHLFFVPPPNQVVGAVNVPLRVVSSSGLPVSLFVDDGPSDAIVSELLHLFSSGNAEGSVMVRATQAGGLVGGLTYAPAADVRVNFEIVLASSATAPRSFAQWQADNGISGSPESDNDGDGASTLEEYAAGTDPKNAAVRPSFMLESSETGEGFILEWTFNGRALIDFDIEATDDLSAPDGWSAIFPRIISIENSEPESSLRRILRFELPVNEAGKQFWRLKLTAR